MIVIPGGGFHFLAALEEEVKLAEWLRARGITAFVLKYRVLQTTPEHIGRLFGESVKENHGETASVFPLAVADARSALTYVRAHADEFGFSRTQVGVIGGSAGAMLVAPDSRSCDRARLPVNAGRWADPRRGDHR